MTKSQSMQTIARKFQRNMEDLGLGVTIQIGDQPPVVVTDPPCEHGYTGAERDNCACQWCESVRQRVAGRARAKEAC